MLPDEMPELTPDDIAEAQNAFIRATERELTIRGAHTPEAIALLNELRSDVRVVSRYTGPEAGLGFGRRNPKLAADQVLETLQDRAAMSAFGPDPVKLLADRLVALGIPANEAQSGAANRLRRVADGRVVALHADGRVAFSGAEVPSARLAEFSPAQLAQYRDPQQALAIATRQILAERGAAAVRADQGEGRARLERIARGAF